MGICLINIFGSMLRNSGGGDKDQTGCKEGVTDPQYSKHRRSTCGRHPNEKSEYSKHRQTFCLSMQYSEIYWQSKHCSSRWLSKHFDSVVKDNLTLCSSASASKIPIALVLTRLPMQYHRLMRGEGEVNIFEGKLVIQFVEEKVSAFSGRCQEIPFHS